MQLINSKLSIKSYLDLSQVLSEYRGSHEDNRSFALKHQNLQKAPTKLLLKWLHENSFRIIGELESKKYMEYLFSLSSLLGIFFFIIGFFVGLGLLSYDGQTPVNIIYYMLISIFIPILSMSISLLSMFSHGSFANFLTMLFPLHWIEKFLNYLPFRKKLDTFQTKFSFEFSKLLFMERLQLFSMFFSIGLLISLLIMVIATDIAFGWSTTLQVSSESFHSIIYYIGFVWEKIIPSAVPSIELVDISHYFRLGEKVNTSMFQNADKLGEWWKFLAMVTLFYAIIMRFLLWAFSKSMLEKQLEKEFLSLNGVSKILREFDTPFISTQAPKKEKHLKIVDTFKTQKIVKEEKRKEQVYSTILGWNFSMKEMLLVNDSQNIKATNILIIGGSNSYLEDLEIVKKLKGVISLYVKSWEPPTMDFVDVLEFLTDNRRIKEVKIYPLGTIGKQYENDDEDVAVWRRKIESMRVEKVWIVYNEK